jgi:hypothetical protein
MLSCLGTCSGRARPGPAPPSAPPSLCVEVEQQEEVEGALPGELWDLVLSFLGRPVRALSHLLQTKFFSDLVVAVVGGRSVKW